MAIDLDSLRSKVAEIDDGEWASPSPYFLWEPDAHAKLVVYATKRDAAARILGRRAGEQGPAIIGHYGLPSSGDIPWLREFLRNRPLYFLGDFDPFDVLIFLALRDWLPTTYIGLTDELLAAFGGSLDDRITIGFSEPEQKAIQLVREICPSYPAIIGPPCAALWEKSRKLELEAIASSELGDFISRLLDPRGS